MFLLLFAAALAQDSDAWETPADPATAAPASETQDGEGLESLEPDPIDDLLDQALEGDTPEPTEPVVDLPDPTWEALIERAPLTFATWVEQPLVVGASEAEWAPGPDLILLADGSVYWGETKILDAYFGGSKLLFPPAGNPLGAKLTLSREPADWEGLPENPGWTATGLIQEEGSFARPVRAVERRPVISGDDAWEAPPVVIDEETWAAWEAGRLLIVETPYDAEVRWVVRDGLGNPVNTRSFARMTSDEEAIALLEAEERKAKITAASVAGGGVLLLGLSTIPLALLDTDLSRPDWDDYTARVDRENYASDDEYLDAIEIQRGLYIAALGEYRTARARNTDRRWTAAALAGTGVIALASAPWAIDGQREDRDAVANTWSRKRAEALIAQYNDELKLSLGIPLDYDHAQAQQAPPPPPPAGGPEEAPTGWESIQVSPALAPGYVGINVRF
ncbi:MAG: hypothetical protein VX899_09235 [Myxococcota bacterium]|nr:hypothetical protein [Myxococcota bacterium]